MDESQFDRLAGDELKRLELRLAAVPEAEVDSTGDVISVEFEDGAKYIVNSHRAARQIWLSAEMRASHYSLDAKTGRWFDDKTGEDLVARLESLLLARVGRAVSLR